MNPSHPIGHTAFYRFQGLCNFKFTLHRKVTQYVQLNKNFLISASRRLAKCMEAGKREKRGERRGEMEWR
jgi:hypothetical protein